MGPQSSQSGPGPGPGPGPEPDRAQALLARDAALGFVRRANRWLISAAVLIAGGLTALTSRSFHAKAATTPQATTTSPAPPASGADSTAGSTAPLQAPSTAPQPVVPQPVDPGQAGPVVSGGS